MNGKKPNLDELVSQAEDLKEQVCSFVESLQALSGGSDESSDEEYDEAPESEGDDSDMEGKDGESGDSYNPGSAKAGKINAIVMALKKKRSSE